MNITPQIDKVDFNYKDTTLAVSLQNKLCYHMNDCPKEVSHMNNRCELCIGEICLTTLRTIEPELNESNLEKTINIWEVLIK